MVRWVVSRIYPGTNKYYVEAMGLSTDNKPENVITGSSFFEIDTGKALFYDEDNEHWGEPGGDNNA